jgi:hypothetical protein
VRLVEDDVARDIDTSTGQVEAAVPFVSRGISKEDTSCRTWCELMRGSGLEVRVAEAPEDAQVGIARRLAVQTCEGNLTVNGGRGTPVEEVTGGREGLGPVRGWHGCVEEQSAHGVVESAKNTLGLAVLCGSVRTREAEQGVVGRQEGGRGSVDEFRAVINLKALNG